MQRVIRGIVYCAIVAAVVIVSNLVADSLSAGLGVPTVILTGQP